MISWTSSGGYKAHDKLAFIFKVKDIENTNEAAIEVLKNLNHFFSKFTYLFVTVKHTLLVILVLLF